jgi:hypothetical protein
MRVILATTNALQYGEELLSKSAASLKRIAKRKSLPVTLEHDGPKVGQATNLAYEVRSGVGYLTGLISDLCGMTGTSLQYTGDRVGNRINIDKVDHVALVRTPRDPIACFSDSTDNPKIRYRDSVEELAESTADKEDKPVDTETGGVDSDVGVESEGVRVELTDEDITQLYESIFSNSDRLKDLVTRIQTHLDSNPTESTESTTDKVETPKADTQAENKPKRFIIKPRVAQDMVPPKAPKPIQQPFKGLL